VPRETWRRWRTQPNPARILTLEPERSEPIDYRESDFGPGPSVLHAQAACGFRYSGSNGSPFFQTCKVMAGGPGLAQFETRGLHSPITWIAWSPSQPEASVSSTLSAFGWG